LLHHLLYLGTFMRAYFVSALQGLLLGCYAR
jgi:hypothetical protein